MDEPLPAGKLGIPRSRRLRKGARRGPRAGPPIARGLGRGAFALLGLRRRARCLSKKLEQDRKRKLGIARKDPAKAVPNSDNVIQ
jgi:hypothetical protein